MDRNPLDLGDGGGDLEDVAMRDVSIGLEDHLAPTRFGAVHDRLPRLFQRGRRPFSMTQQQSRLTPSGRGFGQSQECRRRFLHTDPVPSRGHVDFLAPAHLDGKEHEGHELENHVDHRRHVDVLVPFLIDVAAE